MRSAGASTRSRAALRLAVSFALLVPALTVSAAGDENPPASEVETAASPSPAASDRIDEVLVRARKRTEFLEDTPVSVTALSEAQLRMTGTTRIDQMQTLVPNLSVFRGLSGDIASFNMRGVGNFPTIYFDQGVGVYVDGVYLARNSGTVLDIVDVQQIEVLRGPQGTLFGKNTLGGAVSVTTIKPRNEREGFALIRTGSYGQIDTKAMVNFPVDIGYFRDKLFTRLTFASFKHDGYTKNTLRDERASDRNSLNFLGSLRFLPHKDVTVDLTGTWSRNDSRGYGGKCTYVKPRNTGQGGFQTIVDSIDQVAGGLDKYRRRCNASEPFRFEADGRMIADIETYGLWGVLSWDIGPVSLLEDLQVKLTTSWREQKPENRTDADQTRFDVSGSAANGGGPFARNAAGPLAGQGVDLGGDSGFQQQIQEELQVNATAWDDRVSLVGGAFGFWEEAEEHTGINYLPGTVLSDPPVGLGQSRGDNEVDNWDWALYGQATLDFTDWLSLTGGVRYTQEKKELSRLLQQPFAEPPIGDPLPVDFEGRDVFTAWTPMASIALSAPDDWLDVTVLDHLMGYFSYSEGFRGGGFNGGARTPSPTTLEPFDPEFITSYEWGLKTIGFDHRATLNFSVFRSEREDQQVPQLFQADIGAIQFTDVLVRNAAQSTEKGFEAETSVQPLDGLLITASAGYLDTEYDDFPGAQNSITGKPINRAGQSFSFLPEWQTHVGLQYSRHVAVAGPEWLSGTFTPRIDWSWQSETTNWAPEIKELHQNDFNIVDLRLGYDFDDDRSGIAFFVKNLTDTEYFRDSLALGPRLSLSVVKYYEPPRWFGVELSRRF